VVSERGEARRAVEHLLQPHEGPVRFRSTGFLPPSREPGPRAHGSRHLLMSRTCNAEHTLSATRGRPCKVI
jgi:hypothetical protein